MEASLCLLYLSLRLLRPGTVRFIDKELSTTKPQALGDVHCNRLGVHASLYNPAHAEVRIGLSATGRVSAAFCVTLS